MIKDMNDKPFVIGVSSSIIATIILQILFYYLSDQIELFKQWTAPVWLKLTLSSVFTFIFVEELVRRNHYKVRTRIYKIRFLSEDSASKAFDHFIDTIKKIILEYSRDNTKSFEKDVFHEIKNMVSLRRQPMQIIENDCEELIRKKSQLPDLIPIERQFIYYLDFLKSYKLNAIQSIIRHSDIYFETFLNDQNDDYIVTYGHSTNVVKAIISCYKKYKYPIIIIEDQQYHKKSLREHAIVAQNLEEAGIKDFHLISFDLLKDLYDTNVVQIIDSWGNRLTLSPKRRLHALIGAERINLRGDTLVPSVAQAGRPSETASLIESFVRHADKYRETGHTIARLVIITESYKVRNYDDEADVETGIPFKLKTFYKYLWIAGIYKKLPQDKKVKLYEINAENIFAHINELGIFPNFSGKFNLKACADAFENETNLLGYFNRPQIIKYIYFDEIKAVIFDFNGVIIDDEEFHYEAFKITFQKYGFDLNIEIYDSFCKGRNDKDGIAGILETYSILNEKIDSDILLEQKSIEYKNQIKTNGIKLFNGVQRVLKGLSDKGYTKVLVTSSKKDDVEKILTHSKIYDYFEAIITDEDVVSSKPSSEGYRLAADILKLHPNNILVIEDSIKNLESAKKLGMRTLGITHDSNCMFESCDFCIKSIDQILTY